MVDRIVRSLLGSTWCTETRGTPQRSTSAPAYWTP